MHGTPAKQIPGAQRAGELKPGLKALSIWPMNDLGTAPATAPADVAIHEHPLDVAVRMIKIAEPSPAAVRPKQHVLGQVLGQDPVAAQHEGKPEQGGTAGSDVVLEGRERQGQDSPRPEMARRFDCASKPDNAADAVSCCTTERLCDCLGSAGCSLRPLAMSGGLPVHLDITTARFATWKCDHAGRG